MACLEKNSDIGALVFDLGQHSTRVGYGQDLLPIADIPSAIGVSDDGNLNAVSDEYGLDIDFDTNNITTCNKKYFIDTTTLNFAKSGKRVINYMKDGMIEDWDLFEKVLDYAYARCIQSDSKCHPILMSESPWNVTNKREKLMEIMFEKYNVPAFYLAKNAALAALGNGRQSGLILDSGASHTSATAVHEGYVVSQTFEKTPLGGDFITQKCKDHLQERNIEAVPYYQVASKKPVKEYKQAQWVPRNDIPLVTSSWHNYMVNEMIEDFKKVVLEISETPYDQELASYKPSAHYEFPNGYNQDFGCIRYRIPEALFDPSILQTYYEDLVDDTMLGAVDVVAACINKCTPNDQPRYYSNVIITGGNSQIKGFPERLLQDLSYRTPYGIDLKITQKGNLERRFTSWMGGSILVSMKSFQKQWISGKEYYEYGKRQISRKCP